MKKQVVAKSCDSKSKNEGRKYYIDIYRIPSIAKYDGKKSYRTGNKYARTYIVDDYKSVNVCFLVQLWEEGSAIGSGTFLITIKKHYYMDDTPKVELSELYFAIFYELIENHKNEFKLKKDKFMYVKDAKEIDIFEEVAVMCKNAIGIKEIKK